MMVVVLVVEVLVWVDEDDAELLLMLLPGTVAGLWVKIARPPLLPLPFVVVAVVVVGAAVGVEFVFMIISLFLSSVSLSTRGIRFSACKPICAIIKMPYEVSASKRK